MQTIWKFPLEITDEQEINMPAEATVLSVGFQGDQLCAWALVNNKHPDVKRTFFIVGTGHPAELVIAKVAVEAHKAGERAERARVRSFLQRYLPEAPTSLKDRVF